MFRNTDVRCEMAAMKEFEAHGMTVYDLRDEKSREEHDRKILGFEDESPKAKVLADIGTHIIETSHDGKYDVGMVVSVTVKSGGATDYVAMMQDIARAKTIDELRRVAKVYRGLPGALALAKILANDMGYELDDVSA